MSALGTILSQHGSVLLAQRILNCVQTGNNVAQRLVPVVFVFKLDSVTKKTFKRKFGGFNAPHNTIKRFVVKFTEKGQRYLNTSWARADAERPSAFLFNRCSDRVCKTWSKDVQQALNYFGICCHSDLLSAPVSSGATRWSGALSAGLPSPRTDYHIAAQVQA